MGCVPSKIKGRIKLFLNRSVQCTFCAASKMVCSLVFPDSFLSFLATTMAC